MHKVGDRVLYRGNKPGEVIVAFGGDGTPQPRTYRVALDETERGRRVEVGNLRGNDLERDLVRMSYFYTTG